MKYYKERFWDDGDMVLVEGDDGEWCRRDDVDAAIAALRAELAAMTARAEQAEMDAANGKNLFVKVGRSLFAALARNDRRAASARRVAAYCRQMISK